jgi:5-methylcytosine-specific restriction protein B
MKRGDIVYVKKGQTDIVGWGVVSSNHQYKNDKNIIQLVPSECSTENNSLNFRIVSLYGVILVSVLFNVLIGIFQFPFSTTYPIYTAEQFLDDVFMNEEDYDTLVQLIRRKKNVFNTYH